MKTVSILASGRQYLGRRASWSKLMLLAPAFSAALLLGSNSEAVAQSQSLSNLQLLAQISSPPAPPVPTGYGGANSSSQQYIVYVDGADPTMLGQVRRLQPDAFPIFHGGRSVIQTGRFNSYQNAQQQASSLASLGLGADIAEVPAATLSYSQSVPSAPSYTATGQLPALPVVPVPAAPGGTPGPQANASQNVEFGQPPSFPQAPTSNVTAAPLEAAPPTLAPEQNSRTVAAGAINAPYYVVIPAPSQELPSISSRVIQLGTPAAQVQNRNQPFGPHVAVGPFRDRGLARQWSNFFREAGYRSSRVHFEP